ncbi:MAG: hypothetical protein D6795_15955 [Deltaproteobacteria bacterium]|nr:MAG: hypothetical protein D6795_15955 [Deltaproteobacteria bacterium]
MWMKRRDGWQSKRAWLRVAVWGGILLVAACAGTSGNLKGGIDLFEQGRYRDAITEFQHLLETDPEGENATAIKEYLVRSYEAWGDSILARTPPSPEDFELALEKYEQAVRIAKNNRMPPKTVAHALRALGGAYLRYGKPERAVMIYTEALTLQPEGAEAKSGLLSALHAWGDADAGEGAWAAAETRFRRALAIDPEDPYATLRLGEVLGRQGKIEEAQKLLERALILDPRSPEVFKALGEIELRLGNVESALRNLKKSLAIDPDFAPTHRLLGDLYAAGGHPAEGVEAYLAAAMADPDPVTWLRVGDLFAERLDEPTLAFYYYYHKFLPSAPKPLRAREEPRIEAYLEKIRAVLEARKEVGRQIPSRIPELPPGRYWLSSIPEGASVHLARWEELTSNKTLGYGGSEVKPSLVRNASFARGKTPMTVALSPGWYVVSFTYPTAAIPGGGGCVPTDEFGTLREGETFTQFHLFEAGNERPQVVLALCQGEGRSNEEIAENLAARRPAFPFSDERMKIHLLDSHVPYRQLRPMIEILHKQGKGVYATESRRVVVQMQGNDDAFLASVYDLRKCGETHPVQGEDRFYRKMIAKFQPDAAITPNPNRDCAVLHRPSNLSFPTGVHFHAGSTEFTEDSWTLLEQVVHTMLSYPHLAIRIESSVVGPGDLEENRKLAQRRGERTKAYLVARGVSPERIEVLAHAADHLGGGVQKPGDRIEFHQLPETHQRKWNQRS